MAYTLAVSNTLTLTGSQTNTNKKNKKERDQLYTLFLANSSSLWHVSVCGRLQSSRPNAAARTAKKKTKRQSHASYTFTMSELTRQYCFHQLKRASAFYWEKHLKQACKPHCKSEEMYSNYCRFRKLFSANANKKEKTFWDTHPLSPKAAHRQYSLGATPFPVTWKVTLVTHKGCQLFFWNLMCFYPSD